MATENYPERNLGGVYLHRLESKSMLKELIAQVRTKANSLKTSADDPNLPSSESERVWENRVSRLLQKLDTFNDKYVSDINDLLADREKHLSRIAQLESNCEDQRQKCLELSDLYQEEQILRHKAENCAKDLSIKLRKKRPVDDSNPDLENETEDAAEDEQNHEPVEDPHPVVAELEVPNFEQRIERMKSLFEGEKLSLSSQIDLLKEQLEIEQDKISKLQQIVSEYHIEKAKADKMTEDSIKERKKSQNISVASRHSSAHVTKTLGTGEDFFEEMFNEPKFLTLANQMLLTNGFVTSSIGSLRIDNIHKEGNFITLRNASPDTDELIGLYVLQQKIGGKTVASFRFPIRAKLPAGCKLNIWACSVPEARDFPPYDYIWKNQFKCGYGLECITVLTKPNGQAVAWYCGKHQYNDDNINTEINDYEMLKRQSRLISMTEEQISENDPKRRMVQLRPFIRREKSDPNIGNYDVRKHPHGLQIHDRAHPKTDEFREKFGGNDQTSLMRHIRLPRTPDIVPELYTGAARTGSSALSKYVPEVVPNLVPIRSTTGMMRKLSAAQVAAS